MTGSRAWSLGLLAVGCYLGCSGGEDDPGTGSNYSSTNSGTTGGETSGVTGSSNVSSSSASSNSASTNGASSNVQGASTVTNAVSSSSSVGTTGQGSVGGTGGSGQGGQGGTAMAAGGTAGTSDATTTTDGGGSGGGTAVDPSAGCDGGNASPSLNVGNNTIVHLPPSYDGSTPVPVVMAFHAAGNPNTQLQDRYEDDLGDKYLMLYPKSQGNEWNNNADGGIVDTMFSALESEACIDKNRVFAVGHSSGSQFIVQRLCAGETRWRAVAPVASSKYCNSWNPVPALVFHGIGDQERSWDPNGEEDIVPYRTSNGCMESSTPYPVDGCQSGGVQVDPGCVQFDGCSEITLWCQHNDPQYGTSHHGIPCFADSLIREFFDSF